MRSAAYFQYISIVLNLEYNKNKMQKTLDFSCRDMLNFNFSENGPGLVSPPHSVYDFSRKCFSCYILLTDLISLNDCLYYLRFWAICVLQLFVNYAVTS